jgi:hypothetical protein
MFDLDDQRGRVWNPDVQPLVDEAFRCYSTGSARAAITLTWVAVCLDIIEKLRRLAEDGESVAKTILDQIERAYEQPDSAAVKIMQDIERTILTTARQTELIDTIGERELGRLREDRHLCAHPSLRPAGEFYEPRPEYARAHLSTALQTLLVHPPVQGRKVIERFRAHLIEPTFTDDPVYLIHIFMDRVGLASRRQIIDLAVKHAMLELDGPEGSESVVLADRMASCVRVFAIRERDVVRAALQRNLDRFRDLRQEEQLRGVARLGRLDLFWDVVDQPVRARISDLIDHLLPTTAPWEPLDNTNAAVLSLVSDAQLRSELPSLVTTFQGLEANQKASVIAQHPDTYFAAFTPSLLKDAWSFRTAEFVTQEGCGAVRAITDHRPVATSADRMGDERPVPCGQRDALAVTRAVSQYCASAARITCRLDRVYRRRRAKGARRQPLPIFRTEAAYQGWCGRCRLT